MTLAELIEIHGEAYYVKIDIEGSDRAAIESLGGTAIRPRYISMETTFSVDPTFAAARGDLEALAGLGYDRFKIVDQQALPAQVPPNPPLIGTFVDWRFSHDGSGLFGDEAPGQWLTTEEALTAFRRLIRRKWLQRILYPKPRLYLYYCAIIHRLTGRYPNLGWYDIHARHSTAG